MMSNHGNCTDWCIVGSGIMSMAWDLPVTGPHSLDLALVCLSLCVLTVRCWEPDCRWSFFFFFFRAVCFWFLFPEVFKKAARLLVTISRSGPFGQKVWFNREAVIYYSGAAAAPVRPGPDQAPRSCPQDLTLFPFSPLPLCLNPQYKSQCFGSPSGAYYCLWGIKDH